MPRPARKAIPLRVKLASALIALGFHPQAAAKASGIELPYLDPLFRPDAQDEAPHEIEWHHQPSLGLRQDWSRGLMPDANDPRYIVPIRKTLHARMTNGDPAVPLSGDKAKIAKVKRLEQSHARREAFMNGMYAHEGGFDPTSNPYEPRTPERKAWADGWSSYDVQLPRKSRWPKGRKIPSRKVRR